LRSVDRAILAGSFALAAASGCFDYDITDRPCASDNDCLSGRVCDLAKKACAPGARDAGTVFDVGSDVGEGDAQQSPPDSSFD